jgi:YD repeat-containing protein
MDGKLQTITSYDQLGRIRLTQKSDGAAINSESDGIKVRTFESYPSGGRRVVTSTPYRNVDRSDATLKWTCTQYDELGRITAAAMFKGSAVPADCASTTNRTGVTVTQYDADWTIVTDPAGKVRKQRRDALGRLVEVVEDPSNLNYSTTYTYSPLDNLTQVVQGTQTRSFSYSSLSRLLSATNPESGTVTYTYDNRGNLATRIDARGVGSAMTYDPLHRILARSYTDGTPTVTYEYYLPVLRTSGS